MSTIFLIRHAEKPEGKDQAVGETGVRDKEALTVRGWQRAGALAVLFGAKGGLLVPDRIYASAAGKEKVAPATRIGSDSERPVLTVTPLAARLGLTIIEKFTKGQEADLAKDLVKQQGTTLVCWQHEAIPAIAKLVLGAATGVPDPWPGDRFDVVWRFTRAEAGTSWTFSQVCPQLLVGDRSSPIA
jgi:hypothetical protein